MQKGFLSFQNSLQRFNGVQGTWIIFEPILATTKNRDIGYKYF